MRIIFTDKLSKVVAQYENLRDMIFDLNISLDISWDPGEESIQYHGQDLTLNDVSSQNEVRASRYLTLKNNKITVEEEQQDINKLLKLCFDVREKGLYNCRQKWLTTLCLSGRRMCITWYLCLSNWDRFIPKWFCHHSTVSSCMHNVKTYSPPV